MPSPSTDEETRIQAPLTVEINKQDNEHLQIILWDIIRNCPKGREIASKWLFLDKKDVKSKPAVPASATASTPALPGEEESTSTSSSKKPVLQNCIYCLEEFDPAQNSHTSCQYHVEPAIPDKEYFFDEISDGINVDTDQFRATRSEGFFYPCCGMELVEGWCCQVDWHKAADPNDRPLMVVMIRDPK
ncbi:uncharacterized protein N7479_009035 [Penicillium vulpinum]|uniref:uncharacterized protein n=1 Tax=Penicillium vulpinum TaxID=29845 RepID=UPI0025488F4B|nr:uncharacterized protein N7479_009035 [Penicillium vulpinum]KAJ5950622.1 hypothetical protein N7479_009035 [Penicillium vulpinum]